MPTQRKTVALLPSKGKSEEQLLKEMIQQLESKGIKVKGEGVDKSKSP